MSAFDERYKMYGNLGNSFGGALAQLAMALKQKQDQDEAKESNRHVPYQRNHIG